MTESHDSADTRPISVAELLAKNGTIGAPVPNRRRHRRGNSDAVTVAELTGEIPIIDEDIEPEPRWPQSASPRPREPRPQSRERRPEPGPYPLPSRNNVRVDAQDQPADRSGAEGMNPDPLEGYAGMSVDVMDADVRDVELASEDSAYVRSYLGSSAGQSRGKGAVSDVESPPDAIYRDAADIVDEQDYPDDLAGEFHDQIGDSQPWSRVEALRVGGTVVLQSILAVGFGAGLFIAFDQLWRWNNIVALALSVLVILGLVVGVRVVRKTEDIGSTLIAVAVGALVTLGPLALLQSG
ncbi:hypothetical protein [Candidatus Mycobacterium methanotrophicum]|uniref:Transmembrane protein n=1 Tax=Candidatus Mycobacterium methanotrophicum TaxID=2943498 RepID=A0ABY4QMA3_9MYCO|nr:hypothetical protein [Candidatus Mycobacterium methanotrophicum]UQX11999.1 hypothetical protein M5I08_06505 [Candidatus Mycobacterium methanotrophicum]